MHDTRSYDARPPAFHERELKQQQQQQQHDYPHAGGPLPFVLDNTPPPPTATSMAPYASMPTTATTTAATSPYQQPPMLPSSSHDLPRKSSFATAVTTSSDASPHAARATLATRSPTAAAKPLVDKPQFSTQVDLLVRTIQQKAEAVDEASGKASPPQLQMQSLTLLPTGETGSGQEEESGPIRKPYACHFEGCSMTFWQKTHLEIHHRSHTGEKPYECRYAGCGAHFSQLGNLRTHERRHSGERPFCCVHCGKFFAQRSNLRAHSSTHLHQQPYACRVDGCPKRFTQLGNAKAHHNKYHAARLRSLNERIAAADAGDEAAAASITKADRELSKHLATLYKNSNRGIKGRGKQRRVPLVWNAGAASARTGGTAALMPTRGRPSSMAAVTVPGPSQPPRLLMPQHRDHQGNYRTAAAAVPGPLPGPLPGGSFGGPFHPSPLQPPLLPPPFAGVTTIVPSSMLSYGPTLGQYTTTSGGGNSHNNAGSRNSPTGSGGQLQHLALPPPPQMHPYGNSMHGDMPGQGVRSGDPRFY